MTYNKINVFWNGISCNLVPVYEINTTAYQTVILK